MTKYRYLSGTVMPVPDPTVLPSLPTEHLPTCFGCGSENPDGLHLEVRYEQDRVVVDVAFDKRHEGGPGLVHGGMSAAVLDDLIGFVMIAHRQPGVTANLSVNYLRPIPVGMHLRAEAWMTRVDGRKMFAEAVAFDDQGTNYLEATALFLSVGLEHFQDALKSIYESDEYYP